MNFLLMYFKIPYDFMIYRSIFTIRVCFAFSMPCQNRDFNNLGFNPLTPIDLIDLPVDERVGLDGNHKAQVVKKLDESVQQQEKLCVCDQSQ